MNPYQKAIERHEVKQFLLGRGEYFFLERDWGTHDSTHTGWKIWDYARLHGEEKLYQQLDKDLIMALSDETISVLEFSFLINYIWIYFVNKEEGKYHHDWSISTDLKRQIQWQLAVKTKQGQNLKHVYARLDLLNGRFGFTLD